MMVSKEIGSEADESSGRIFRLLDRADRGIVGGYQKKMARYLSEIAGMEELPHFASKRVLPVQVLRYFQKVVELYDNSTQYHLSRLQRQGIVVQCRMECHHCCCNMPSGLSTLELIYIYNGLCRTPMASRLFRRCLEVEELWGEIQRGCHGIRSGEIDCASPREMALKSYQGLCRPCPFLQNALCVIYPFRPFACRMHFSISPACWCDPSHFQKDYAVRFNLEPGECVQEVLARIDERFGLNISDIMVCGLLELTVNTMQFEPVDWQ